MRRWLASRDELAADHARLREARRHVRPHQTAYRIAFHDRDQQHARILVPDPWEMAFLMAGGIIRHVRVAGDCPETGGPILEGRDELLAAMSEREAVEFIGWKCIPPGTNRVRTITTADLPATRAFRNAWILKDAA